MPFVSKSQWRQCFAAARRGQRKVSQCKEFASMSKSYKSLPKKVRKLRRTRRRIHQKAPQAGTIVYIDQAEQDVHGIPVGVYGINEQDQWAEYLEVDPGDFQELDLVENPNHVQYLDEKWINIANQQFVAQNPEEGQELEEMQNPQTPHIQHMDIDEEEPTDIQTPYGMSSPKTRKTRGRRRQTKKKTIRQRATAYDLPASLADAQRLPDEMEEDMDSPYDDFSYDVDDRNDIIDFEIDEAEREYKDYNQMATKVRKTIKKRGGSKRRYRRQH